MEFSLQCGIEIGKREGELRMEDGVKRVEKYLEVWNSNKFVYA
jgi:hypothetical protein